MAGLMDELGKAVSKLSDLGGKAVEGAKDLFEKAKPGIEDTFEKVTDGARNLAEKVRQKLSAVYRPVFLCHTQADSVRIMDESTRELRV